MTALQKIVRRLINDPAAYQNGCVDGRPLDECERTALEIELQTMMQLSLATTLPGDCLRESVIKAYEAVHGFSTTSLTRLAKVEIPAGR